MVIHMKGCRKYSRSGGERNSVCNTLFTLTGQLVKVFVVLFSTQFFYVRITFLCNEKCHCLEEKEHEQDKIHRREEYTDRDTTS